jgi:hypothetical protein
MFFSAIRMNIHILAKSRVFSLCPIGALLAQGTTQQNSREEWNE